MIKKTILSLASAVLIFAANTNTFAQNEKEATAYMQKNLPVIYQEIAKKTHDFKFFIQPLKGTKLKIITLKTNGQSTYLIITPDNKYVILPLTVINAKTGKPIKIKHFINKQDIEKGVDIVAGKGNKDLYLVTDPECPFCRKLISSNKYQEILNKYRVHIIIIPLSYHKYARQMTYYILSAKNNNERFKRFIAVMKGKDNNWINYTPTKKEKAEFDKQIKASQKAAVELGVRGTPSAYDGSFNYVNPFFLEKGK